MFEDLKQALQERKKQELYRKPLVLKGLDFCSNDYLGLSQHPQIKKDLIQFLKSSAPVSSKASPLLAGYQNLQAEKALQKFVQRPAVLCFSSGYQLNLGLIPALAKQRVIFSDEENHASLIDGIRLSQRPYFIFKHNDLNHLEDLLKKEKGLKMIVTEALFSMSGDFSPLEALADLALKYQALLVLDEAHTTGLFGKNLGGLATELKNKEMVISIHTGAKALACFGAFVACSPLVKEYLINHCRSWIYSSAPSPLLSAQFLSTLKVLKKERHRAEKLKQKALEFRQSLSLPTNPIEKQSPIVFIPLKSTKKALQLSKLLQKKNYFIPAIRYPTVPKNRQGLRIIIHYNQTKKQLKKLSQTLKNIL